jgi:hypothetical protein
VKVIFKDGLEEGGVPYDVENPPAITVPKGWFADWDTDPQDGVLDRPECHMKDRNAGQPEVRTGRYAATMFKPWATYRGVFGITVPARLGDLIAMSAWAYADTSMDAGFGMRIGIDPYGGNDFRSSDVKWSKWWDTNHPDEFQNETWKELTVTAYALASEVTLYLFASTDWATQKGGNAIWDDVTLYNMAEDPEPGDGLTKQDVVDAINETVPGIVESVVRALAKKLRVRINP